jgi:hypothetical protein
MDNSVATAIIAASGAMLVAAITYYLTKKNELDLRWRNEKIAHYKNLLAAISDLAIDDVDKEEANFRFASATNTIALVAPQEVINALMDFHNEIKFSNKNSFNLETHDLLLRILLIKIRKDIKLDSKDKLDDFKFHLIGTKPKKNVK